MAREPSRSTPGPSFLCLKTAQEEKAAGGSWGFWGLGDAGGSLSSHSNVCGAPWSSRRGWAVSEGICVHTCKESVASPHSLDTGSLSGFHLDAFTSTPSAAPLGWGGLVLGKLTQPSTSWPFPPLWRDKSHGAGIAQHWCESCQMLSPGRCDMGEHSCILGQTAW